MSKRDLGPDAVAELLGVSAKFVVKRIDDGTLPGYRLPGSNYRRVRPADLAGYCRTHGIPVPAPITEGEVLLASPDARLRAALADVCTLHAADAYHAGKLLATHAVAVAVLDTAIGRPEALTAARDVRGHLAVLVVAGEDETRSHQFGTEVYRRPFDPRLLAAAVRSLLNPEPTPKRRRHAAC